MDSNTSDLASNNEKTSVFAINMKEKVFKINWAFICLNVFWGERKHMYAVQRNLGKLKKKKKETHTSPF